MDEKQRRWTRNKCNELMALAKYPLDEYTAELIYLRQEDYVQKSHNHPEVKQAILQTLILIDNTDRAHRQFNNKVGDLLND